MCTDTLWKLWLRKTIFNSFFSPKPTPLSPTKNVPFFFPTQSTATATFRLMTHNRALSLERRGRQPAPSKVAASRALPCGTGVSPTAFSCACVFGSARSAAHACLTPRAVCGSPVLQPALAREGTKCGRHKVFFFICAVPSHKTLVFCGKGGVKFG